MFVSQRTGLTVVTVYSSTNMPVTNTDRQNIVKCISNVVLINSHGSDSLLLGVDKPPSEVERLVVGLNKDLPGLFFSLKDVSAADPFDCFRSSTKIPRVNEAGLYQMMVRCRDEKSTEARRSLEELVSSLTVARADWAEDGMIVQVNHVLELLAYTDCLEQEAGVTVGRLDSWNVRPLDRVKREERVGERDRILWVRVTDSEFNSLDVAHKQLTLQSRLSVLGRVIQLESSLFGLKNNYLAVIMPGEKLFEAENMILVELSRASLPTKFIPTLQVNSHGFYSLFGRFPEDISQELRHNFAQQIKKIGAVGFSGGEPDFSLYFVNSRSAEKAFSLSEGLFSNLNLKIFSPPDLPKVDTSGDINSASEKYLTLKMPRQETGMASNVSKIIGAPRKMVATRDVSIGIQEELNSAERFLMTEDAVFGFLGGLDEKVISYQLTDFIKYVKCSEITAENDGLVFHFSKKEDFYDAMAKYCPQLIHDQKRFDSLTRNFVYIRSNGSFGIFSPKPLEPEDFQDLPGCKLSCTNRNVWFHDKIQAIRVLRDPKMLRKYPNLNISFKNIRLLNIPEPQTLFHLTRFGNNSPFSMLDPRVPSFSPRPIPRRYSNPLPVSQTDFHQPEKGFAVNPLLEVKEIYRNKAIEDAASDILNILSGKINRTITSLQDIKKRGIELQIQKGLGFQMSNSPGITGARQLELNDRQKTALDDVASNVNLTLLFPYHPEMDTETLEAEISWFDDPVSIQVPDLSSSEPPSLAVTMRSKEVAQVVFNGLKVKYPGLQLAKTGKAGS